MYSPLLEAPPFLFIGINPGDEQKKEEKPKEDLDPSDVFEYIYDYRLAKQTRDLFEKAGMGDCFKKSVKTNVYYFATSNANNLWTLFSSLGEDMNRQFHKHAHKWTQRMIEMIKPKIIICEGIMPFNKLSEIYGVSKTREDVCGYFELPDKTPVIGYSRIRSNIKNKCFVADFLRKKCNK